jgi:histone H3/H4
MEMLIVQSKLKKYVKDQSDFSTSAGYVEAINKDVYQAINEAAEHAKKAGRKTVMGKDFNLYVDKPNIEEVLVVASKIKKLIKEQSDMSTSSQVMEQLTVRVQNQSLRAIESAKKAKRKTVMDRDLSSTVGIASEE